MNLQALITAKQRLLLVGPPGCAKTARVLAAAEAAGYETVVMRASLSERVDFGGALVPDTDSGVTRALPLELLADLQSTTTDTLLFLDDLGQAPIDVQAALMRLFDSGYLSPSVLIWGATNRPGDVAGVTRLCEPLRSRFHLAYEIPAPVRNDKGEWEAPTAGEGGNGGVHIGTWQNEVDGWCEWALDNGAPAEVIAWHRSTTGKTLYQWTPNANPAVRMPDYRSWETVVNLWNAGLRDYSTIAAAVGKGVAAEFVSFAQLADELPTPDQVWMDPTGAPVPTKPAALYLTASMLAAAAEPKFAGALCTYMDRMPRVYGALLGRDAFRRLGATLAGTKEWSAWFVNNQDIFTN